MMLMTSMVTVMLGGQLQRNGLRIDLSLDLGLGFSLDLGQGLGGVEGQQGRWIWSGVLDQLLNLLGYHRL